MKRPGFDAAPVRVQEAAHMPNKIDPELGDVPPAVHESEVSRQQKVAALTATREPSLH